MASGEALTTSGFGGAAMNKLLVVLFLFVAWPVVAALAHVPVTLPLQLLAHALNSLFTTLNLPIRLP